MSTLIRSEVTSASNPVKAFFLALAKASQLDTLDTEQPRRVARDMCIDHLRSKGSYCDRFSVRAKQRPKNKQLRLQLLVSVLLYIYETTSNFNLPSFTSSA